MPGERQPALISNPSRAPHRSRFRAPSTDMTLREARMPLDPKNQLHRAEVCELHRFWSEPAPRTDLSHRILARFHGPRDGEGTKARRTGSSGSALRTHAANFPREALHLAAHSSVCFSLQRDPRQHSADTRVTHTQSIGSAHIWRSMHAPRPLLDPTLVDIHFNAPLHARQQKYANARAPVNSCTRAQET